MYAKEQARAHGFNAKNDKSPLWLEIWAKRDSLVCAKPNRHILAYISGWGGQFELCFQKFNFYPVRGWTQLKHAKGSCFFYMKTHSPFQSLISELILLQCYYMKVAASDYKAQSLTNLYPPSQTE